MNNTRDNNSENKHGEILSQIDIKTAIDYFGVTELLDNIGMSTIENYLAAHQTDRSHKENDGIRPLRKPASDSNEPSGLPTPSKPRP